MRGDVSTMERARVSLRDSTPASERVPTTGGTHTPTHTSGWQIGDRGGGTTCVQQGSSLSSTLQLHTFKFKPRERNSLKPKSCWTAPVIRQMNGRAWNLQFTLTKVTSWGRVSEACSGLNHVALNSGIIRCSCQFAAHALPGTNPSLPTFWWKFFFCNDWRFSADTQMPVLITIF